MDYRDLLKRYIKHVAECEGSTFIDSWHDELNEGEKKELYKLYEEDIIESQRTILTKAGLNTAKAAELLSKVLRKLNPRWWQIRKIIKYYRIGKMMSKTISKKS